MDITHLCRFFQCPFWLNTQSQRGVMEYYRNEESKSQQSSASDLWSFLWSLMNLLVVSLIDFLSLRHTFLIHNTLNIEKSNEHWFALAFCEYGKSFVSHSSLCCFVSGSYLKNTQFITCCETSYKQCHFQYIQGGQDTHFFPEWDFLEPFLYRFCTHSNHASPFH